VSSLKRLIAEIHRRSLWQVLMIYVGAAWACFELIDAVTDRLGLPAWLPGLAIVLFLLALPIVLATAFVRDDGALAVEGATAPKRVEASEPRGDASYARRATVRRRAITWRNAGLGFVVALAVWGVVATGWWVAYGRAPVAAERKSVAVLPFTNMSADPANEYFSDGMTDDIITHLSSIADLKVISRTSTMKYKNTEKSLREIGAELGVAAILEGGVQRTGDRVRINAQLIDAEKDEHLWADQYDRELTDVFAIQTDIARQIVEALHSTLTSAEREQLERQATANLDAYDVYMQGRFLWNRRTNPDMQRAILLFEQAIALDSFYAAAYAGLADTYATLYSWDVLPWEAAIPPAEQALQRALELDPLLGEARATLANVLELRRDWIPAENEFVRALDLAPGYATAHHWYALMLAKLGRFDEALAEIRVAAELDPLSRIISTNIGWIHYLARDYQAAIDQFEATLASEPNFAYAHTLLGEAYAQLGRYPEAIASMRRSFELEPWPNTQVRLASVYAKSGETTQAPQVVEEQKGIADPMLIAQLFVATGEHERAFEWLQRAVDQRSPFLNELRVEPRYDPIRSDSRFADLLRKLDLE
jgi:TolB-like protein/tetratricopeptide (TPR) repeat protein